MTRRSRAVIYARYSSDKSREASIPDQIRVCRELADRHGWEVVAVFQDAAISGASSFRTGYEDLLAQARSRKFDVVVAESLDRLSRDQTDVALLYKTLKFADVQIWTLSEGQVNEMHVGLKGTMNAMFLIDLAAKTHRGLRGRVEAGKAGGGLSYGYSVIHALNERGERICGDRLIHPDESRVVQRIFAMFAAGNSPHRNRQDAQCREGSRPGWPRLAGYDYPWARRERYRYPPERVVYRQARLESYALLEGPR